MLGLHLWKVFGIGATGADGIVTSEFSSPNRIGAPTAGQSVAR